MTKFREKNTLKYLLILVLSIVVIVINIFLLGKFSDKRKSSTMNKKLDPITYFNREFCSLSLYSEFDEISIPNGSSILIFGINKDVNFEIDKIIQVLEKINLESYNLKIVLKTSKDLISEDPHQQIPLYSTLSNEIEQFFGLDDNSNFTMIINEKNVIKFFLPMIISGRDIQSLLKKYSIESN